MKTKTIFILFISILSSFSYSQTNIISIMSESVDNTEVLTDKLLETFVDNTYEFEIDLDVQTEITGIKFTFFQGYIDNSECIGIINSNGEEINIDGARIIKDGTSDHIWKVLFETNFFDDYVYIYFMCDAVKISEIEIIASQSKLNPVSVTLTNCISGNKPDLFDGITNTGGVSNTPGCDNTSIRLYFDNVKYISGIKVWHSEQSQIYMTRPENITINPAVNTNNGTFIDINNISNHIEFSINSTSGCSIHEIEAFGYSYDPTEEHLLIPPNLCKSNCIFLEGTIFDEVKTSGGIKSNGMGEISLLLDRFHVITGIKIWHNSSDYMYVTYPVSFPVNHGGSNNGVYLPVNATDNHLTIQLDGSDIQIYEVELYGYPLTSVQMRQVYDYDNAGNRIKKTFEIIYDLPDELNLTCDDIEQQPKDAMLESDQEFNDRLSDIELLLYPNPTFGELVIEIKDLPNKDAVIQFELLTNEGRQIWSKQSNELRFKLNMDQYPPGSYLLRLQYQNEVQTYKVIKK